MAPRPKGYPSKKPLDIEDVLIWSVRDEYPKLRDRKGSWLPAIDYPSVTPMFRQVSLGGPIDNWHQEPGYPLAAGDPHPDAVVVFEAIKALEQHRDSPEFDLELTGLMPE